MARPKLREVPSSTTSKRLYNFSLGSANNHVFASSSSIKAFSQASVASLEAGALRPTESAVQTSETISYRPSLSSRTRRQTREDPRFYFQNKGIFCSIFGLMMSVGVRALFITVRIRGFVVWGVFVCRNIKRIIIFTPENLQQVFKYLRRRPVKDSKNPRELSELPTSPPETPWL